MSLTGKPDMCAVCGCILTTSRVYIEGKVICTDCDSRREHWGRFLQGNPAYEPVVTWARQVELESKVQVLEAEVAAQRKALAVHEEAIRWLLQWFAPDPQAISAEESELQVAGILRRLERVAYHGEAMGERGEEGADTRHYPGELREFYERVRHAVIRSGVGVGVGVGVGEVAGPESNDCAMVAQAVEKLVQLVCQNKLNMEPRTVTQFVTGEESLPIDDRMRATHAWLDKKDADLERMADLLDEERLAAKVHAIWSYWMSYQFGVCWTQHPGDKVIPKADVDRWYRQLNTPYADLSEKEKESDRDIVRKFLLNEEG